MKRIYIAILMVFIIGVSCKKDIDLDDTIFLPTDLLFEDLQVGRFSHVIPTVDFTTSIATFNVENEVNDWSGFAISSRNHRNFVKLATSVDSTRFSVWTLQPHAGGNFLVVRPKEDNAFMTLSRPIEIDKILVANTTQVYQTITYGIGNATVGNTFAPGTTVMNTTRKDNLKIIIKGYLGTTATGTVEFLLADRRSDASLRTFTVNDWMPVSLTALGKVDKVVFNLESTDKTAGVMNTPNYFCLDGIRFKENIN
ncbi:DUF4465 domain-containing protein [Pedobacter insulae]|uniref:DUF4465 domain-containing protein n=1 Tax=Pedobacter insulae TaxID=414048 RepID=A0A1I2STV8_9SPHI|nr:DUF4465 domain-containing protein [Pedobacter insulae]SFG56150.1 protein of unknown function [Pedobacter insulae]